MNLWQRKKNIRESKEITKDKRREKRKEKKTTKEANKLSRGSVAVDSLASTFWMKIAPPKVEFMTWLALLGKLNTRDLLQRKGIIAAEANKCTFCAAHPETGDHLLMGCAVSWRVWKHIMEELHMKIETKQTFRQFYDWWMSRRMSRSSQNCARKRFIILGFFATTWSIWQKRNMIIFQDQTYDHQAMCQTVKWRICLWSKAWPDNNQYTIEELVRHFNSIPRLFS